MPSISAGYLVSREQSRYPAVADELARFTSDSTDLRVHSTSKRDVDVIGELGDKSPMTSEDEWS
jgi:hypothetical protein